MNGHPLLLATFAQAGPAAREREGGGEEEERGRGESMPAKVRLGLRDSNNSRHRMILQSFKDSTHMTLRLYLTNRSPLGVWPSFRVWDP